MLDFVSSTGELLPALTRLVAALTAALATSNQDLLRAKRSCATNTS